MTFKRIALFLIGIILDSKAAVHHFPEDVHIDRCHRDDPKISECLLKATRDIKPYLIKGIPNMHFPSIDPFIVPEVVLEHGNGPDKFKAVFKNAVITGLSKYEFDDFKFDQDALEFSASASANPVTIEGDYELSGKLLTIPMEGKGRFESVINSIKCDIFHAVKIIQKKGKDFLSPVKSSTKLEIADTNLKFHNLFEKDPNLAKIASEAIDQNSDELFNEIKPNLEKIVNHIWEEVLLKSLEKIIPYDELFPPSS